MPSPSPVVRTVKTYAVTPRPNLQAPHQIHLSAWDTVLLSCQYIRNGLLFKIPSDLSLVQIIEQLRSSLEEALFHFYPLSGRIRTVTCKGGGVTCHVEVGCEGEGAEFVHAVADGITIADVVAVDGQDLPEFLKEFFPIDLAFNFDGFMNPLLTAQVTELVDGIFIGCAFNHAIGDGTSFWMFFNGWAEIARCKAAGKEVMLSQLPVHERWFIGGYGDPPIKLPYVSPAEFVVRFTPPPLRQRMFHFSSETLAKLKARVNQEWGKGGISTFQALNALMWRCITRARRFPPDQKTSYLLTIQNRARLQPPLPANYFGNSLSVISINTTAGELIDNNLGWAARLVHDVVATNSDSTIKEEIHKYMANPIVANMNMYDKHAIIMTNSPRFDMYGCDFGWGKAVAVRSSSAYKTDGMILSYPGWEGGGSIDLEVCLLPEYMSALEQDEEFLAVVSQPVELEILLGMSN